MALADKVLLAVTLEGRQLGGANRSWWRRCPALLGNAGALGSGLELRFSGCVCPGAGCHRAEEKTRVQSLNDFIGFGVMAVGSFLSGGLLSAYGWNTVLWVSFVPLAISVAAWAIAMRRSTQLTADS